MASHFNLEHDFPDIPLDKFTAHLNDPKLNQMLQEGLSFEERAIIKKEENDRETTWQFRVRKNGDLPAAIKKILQGDALAWIETSRFVRKENCIYWQINPVSKFLKFRGEGTWQLKPHKKGCKRIIDGKISVDIPLVGKIIEGLIVNELVKGYETEPKIQQQFYAEVP
jgi:hypothetical protein